MEANFLTKARDSKPHKAFWFTLSCELPRNFASAESWFFVSRLLGYLYSIANYYTPPLDFKMY